MAQQCLRCGGDVTVCRYDHSGYCPEAERVQGNGYYGSAVNGQNPWADSRLGGDATHNGVLRPLLFAVLVVVFALCVINKL